MSQAWNRLGESRLAFLMQKMATAPGRDGVVRAWLLQARTHVLLDASNWLSRGVEPGGEGFPGGGWAWLVRALDHAIETSDLLYSLCPEEGEFDPDRLRRLGWSPREEIRGLLVDLRTARDRAITLSGVQSVSVLG